MLYQFLTSLLFTIISSVSLNEKQNFEGFMKFTEKYKKEYSSSSEFQARYKNYLNNLQEIKRSFIPNKNLKFGINKFADLSKEEFAAKYLTLDSDVTRDLVTIDPNDLGLDDVDAPENWDWTEKGIRTKLKTQLQCGGCWAFATSAAIESQYQINYGQNYSFSEQQLIDCDISNNKCDGGNMKKAFIYLQKHGLMLADEYPFNGGSSDECKYDESKTYVKVKSWSFLPKDEELMKKALYKYGPIASGINAWVLEFYESGIFEPFFDFLCPSIVNHAVVIVGYGVDPETHEKYWKIKNSWGDFWGEGGYFRLLRGSGTCGIDQYNLVVDVEKIK